VLIPAGSPPQPAPAAPRRPVLSSRSSNPSTGLSFTRHQQGFKQFTRPVFPSPVAPGWNGRPRAFPRASHPANQQPDDARRGRDRPPSTDLKQRSRHQPNLHLACLLVVCDLASHGDEQVLIRAGCKTCFGSRARVLVGVPDSALHLDKSTGGGTGHVGRRSARRRGRWDGVSLTVPPCPLQDDLGADCVIPCREASAGSAHQLTGLDRLGSDTSRSRRTSCRTYDVSTMLASPSRTSTR
jgi:hypothetical protein